MNSAEWFETWFDSPFYHILYRNRDEVEAGSFLEALSAKLNLSGSAKVLDLACGSGRHSAVLKRMGYDVVGIDLSPHSIDKARSRVDDVRFEVGDMRSFSLYQTFDLVLNLFTSFGYFGNAEDNVKVLERVMGHLNPEGHFVIDYLNHFKVVDQLVAEEKKKIDGISFDIRRYVEDAFVFKEIRTDDNGNATKFMERVQLFSREELVEMIGRVGFKHIEVFGDYSLSEYTETSDRLILVASK